jgi:DNA-directed RNA polymerase subunit beta
MAISEKRRIQPQHVRRFGRGQEEYEIPDLTKIQTESYRRFLQADVDQERRQQLGLEGILREIFPIASFDGQFLLEYLRYELGKPRYSPDECRQLRLTYGRPL